ncbi:hypothetical protein TTHERM_000324191 (macronuclear) [Tetrahymena thermophila SB210]|uniref:Uncharacterized protein n=1 Tax=Tetrahymena thermophila (strain SB210) TaxID=312017 RepID=W7XJ30_TETTS|nr:hypothetical protein TTHERM_000324191 [Tetrahymena thermophila SB210]EWS75161.1 hypothetical protein TTHERM_000324191 [Tetrahymena thermophila SB210]|eukprot:XP_012652317.1 hypothetical protein TTHERM_000324191 [Tetrahymena thermophila SB210]
MFKVKKIRSHWDSNPGQGIQSPQYQPLYYGTRTQCLLVIFLAITSIQSLNKHVPNKNRQGPTGIRTQVKGFKVPSTNHYTMEPEHSAYLLFFWLVPLGFEPRSRDLESPVLTAILWNQHTIFDNTFFD